MENSRLKVGNYYLCIKDVVMRPSGDIAYIKGKIYKCEKPDALTDELGDTNHSWYNVEEFDPDPYIEALDQYGLPHQVNENPVLVE